MQVLIVEDSRTAAMVLVKLLNDSDLNAQITVASSLKETRDFISTRTFDLIFLDVHLQDGKGTEIINDLPANQKLIFVTGDPQYAVVAFEHQALDYLVKPVDKERFEKSIDRIKEKDEEEGNIVIRADYSFHKVKVADILFVKSGGDYITLNTTGNNFTFHGSLKKFMDKLPQDNFAQCHRSYIINLDKVISLDKNHAILENHQIPISNSHKKKITALFASR